MSTGATWIAPLVHKLGANCGYTPANLDMQFASLNLTMDKSP